MDAEGYIRFVFALAFVLALIGVLAWIARRYGFAPPARRPGQPRRLEVVETIALDSRRRLILLRRDDTEHLLLTGGPNDLLVHSAHASPPVVHSAHASPPVVHSAPASPPIESGIETSTDKAPTA